MNEHFICLADIKNKIYEAGLFREGEKIVLTTENGALLEYFTGKTYSYRMIDITSLKAKRLFSKANPLNETGYQKAIEKILGTGSQSNSAQNLSHEERYNCLHQQGDPLKPQYAIKVNIYPTRWNNHRTRA